MINLYPTIIESLSIHKVTNKNKGEKLFISNAPQRLNDEIQGLIKEYFFKPFREKEECYYKFSHEVDLEFNVLNQIAKDIFECPSSIHANSKKIATHLQEQSTHPHIKSGELYVAYLTGILLDNQKVNAIGIFKSELKQDFFQFNKTPESINLIIQQGINVNKLDKGCLIFNTEQEEGFKILSIDSNRYDTKYWLENFLGTTTLADENFYTKNYIKLCQDFAKDVVRPFQDKQEEVLFMNRAVNHFAKNDEFQESSFLIEVM